MDYTTKHFISKLAEDVRDAYDITTPVHHTNKIIKKIGGTIIESNDIDLVYSPEVCKTGDNSFTIHIRKGMDKKYRRCLVMRALGHLFIHMGYRVSEDVWNKKEIEKRRAFDNDESFEQARYFSMCVLMPILEFKQVVSQHTENDKVNIKEVAKHFKVHTNTATYWGKELELIKR